MARVSQCSVIVLSFARARSAKEEQPNRCSGVHSFFGEDPHRPGHPLKKEAKNKTGMVFKRLNLQKLLFVLQLAGDNSE